ncbi:DUF3182 family protein [Noviherbaspirillum sp. CPCC 100848]|uniref:DUF3182 family protein n=1 Tax=Noviherbaspirillum album TaxID=3080276 RepID=A0ABU6J2W8_9BURK|nr:DUF3182 family protein [Noviherbaspirillum sp. CPCC 100848]MEC4717947.1 DUF3182 family protein [Noviherbaspirillum sp. CPCC 100848]
MNRLHPERDTGRSGQALPEAMHKVVATMPEKADGMAAGHEIATHAEVARRIAVLKGCDFAGEFESGRNYGAPVYFLPSDTLIDCERIQDAGIRCEHDLFGGVVPHAFVATKTITHMLPGPLSPAPEGWSPGFGSKVQEVVLPGYSAFNLHDARDAGSRLLARGAVRLKKPSGVGGLGQWVVRTVHELDDLLHSIQPEEFERDGVVLECNLSKVVTLSVGQVNIGRHLATYHGEQRLTRNHRGEEVYGGSDLTVVRGGFEELLALTLEPDVRTAISQACTYHAAAMSCFPKLFASRSNYDIAQGVDDGGKWRSGVLEQSWRVGGASGAEVAALEAFDADPSLQAVKASTFEFYGHEAQVPAGAVLYFQGDDERVGRITKYAISKAYDHS